MTEKQRNRSGVGDKSGKPGDRSGASSKTEKQRDRSGVSYMIDKQKNRSIVRNMTGKLNSRAGESIAETLVAILIAALALLLLAGTISASSNLITMSSSKLDTYYKANNDIENRISSDSSESASTSTAVVCISAGTTDWVQCEVATYLNEELGDSPVIAYEIQ